MQKQSFATRFGLIALMSVSLFASTAFAGTASSTAAAQGPQQVVVTNTPAQPVPVTLQVPQYYQATQTVNCTNVSHVNYTFNVPSGKTLVVHSVNLFAGSYDPADTFGITMYSDNGSTAWLFFGLQPVGGLIGSMDGWGTTQQVQISATQTLKGTINRSGLPATGCQATINISGELI